MADPTITGSRQFRLDVIAALQGLTLNSAVVPVVSPGDWNVPPESMPEISVRADGGSEQKTPWNKGQPNYTTTTPIIVTGRVSSVGASACQDSLEALQYLIEEAVLTNFSLVERMQQAPVSVDKEITSEGEYHLGRVSMTFTFEFPEVFEPVIGTSLEGLGIHADMAGTFDASSTYTGSLFPASVVPAPRTSGPDGRDEGRLEINLPT